MKLRKKNLIPVLLIIFAMAGVTVMLVDRLQQSGSDGETYFPTTNSKPANYLPFTHSFSAVVLKEIINQVSTTTRKQYEVNLWQNYGAKVPSVLIVSIYGSEADISKTNLEFGKIYGFAATYNETQSWYEVPIGENINNLRKVAEKPTGGGPE